LCLQLLCISEHVSIAHRLFFSFLLCDGVFEESSRADGCPMDGCPMDVWESEAIAGWALR